MLQLQVIRENTDKVLEGLRKRNLRDGEDLVRLVIETDKARRETQNQLDALKQFTTVVADTGSALEDSAITGNLLANDSDVDAGSTLTLTQFSVNGTNYAAGATATVAGVGTLTVAGNGAYSFTPAANYAGAVPTVGYTVSDGSTTSVFSSCTSPPGLVRPMSRHSGASFFCNSSKWAARSAVKLKRLVSDSMLLILWTGLSNLY